MVHLYRGEISRANAWRQRLDATTNWAVVTTGAAISIAFSRASGHHSVLLINMLLITLFLFIEARRYQYYELWSSRIRLMETDFFAGMLVPPFKPSWDWGESLAENLLQPQRHISNWEAFGRRLRRNYLWIYLIMGASWVAKLWLHPVPAHSWGETIQRAAFLGASGSAFLAGVGVVLSLLVLISVLTRPLQEASGEILEMEEEQSSPKPDTGQQQKRFRAWFRPGGRRKQALVHIITACPDQIATEILQHMSRGVTQLEGTGKYTESEKTVLMIALTITEIPSLKEIIRKIDKKAFVIVSPAQDILGGGFEPIQK